MPCYTNGRPYLLVAQDEEGDITIRAFEHEHHARGAVRACAYARAGIYDLDTVLKTLSSLKTVHGVTLPWTPTSKHS